MEQITPFDIFCWGVDYGQLLMEEERDNEDWADAFNCFLFDQKNSMPSQQLPRRQPMSDKWREAKRKSYKEFKEYEKNWFERKYNGTILQIIQKVKGE